MMLLNKISRFTGILVAVGVITSSTQAAMVSTSAATTSRVAEASTTEGKKEASATEIKVATKDTTKFYSASMPSTPRFCVPKAPAFTSWQIDVIQQLFDLAQDSLFDGNEQNAEKFFRAAALKSDLCVSFFYELAIKQFLSLAQELMEKQQDDKDARRCLAWCCEKRCSTRCCMKHYKGTGKIMLPVIAYYETCAEAGDYDAMLWLVKVLGYPGHGVEVRLAEAFKWKYKAEKIQEEFAYLQEKARQFVQESKRQ